MREALIWNYSEKMKILMKNESLIRHQIFLSVKHTIPELTDIDFIYIHITMMLKDQ